MRSWWLSLLVLSAVTLDLGLSQSPEREKLIAEAIKCFNKEENVPNLYKFLNDVPATRQEDKNKSQTLKFEIKETVCPKSAKRDLGQCDYKPDGETKLCTLPLAEKDKDVVKCSSLPKPPRRGRPGSGSIIGFLIVSDRSGS
ncbi:cathelicidin-6-like [Mixophyes fleayi]|uniref:cathelicidin-6-like n=1 Tax=Mixophyes fleayi TaxID=3061075 RepID=UPI003F4DBF0A